MAARENPVPLALWLALGAAGLLVGGTIVYVATRSSAPAVPMSTGPAIVPAQPPPSAVSTAASAALVAAQAAAAAQAALLNTTYVLTVDNSKNIALKVGDTIRLVPSMTGMPPVDRVWKWGSFDASILQNLGSSNGVDIILKAVGPGSLILNVQNVDVATGKVQYASYDVTITVTAS